MMPAVPAASFASASPPLGGNGSLAHQIWGGAQGTSGPFSNAQASPLATFLSLAVALLGGGSGPPALAEGDTGATVKLPPGLVQNLPFPLPASVDSAAPGSHDGADISWEALLGDLSAQAALSPALLSLLGKGEPPLTPGTLQARLNALDEDQREAVLGELAALLAPNGFFAQPVLPSSSPEGQAGLKGVGALAEARSADGEKTTEPPAAGTAHSSASTRRASEDTSAGFGVDTATALALNQAEAEAARREEMKAQDQQRVSSALALAAGEGAKGKAERAAEAVAAHASPEVEKNGKDDHSKLSSPASSSQTRAGDAGFSFQPVAPASPGAKISGPSTTSTKGLDTSGGVARSTGGGEAGQNRGAASSGMQDGATSDTSSLLSAANASAAASPDVRATSFAERLAKANRHGAFAPVTDQVAVHLSRSLRDGQDRTTIRLHPTELGRIEVTLEMTADGRVNARFSVDQPATLELLQRDQKGLERALSDAGLKSDSSSLNFNLRDGGQQQGQAHPQHNGQGHEQGQRQGTGSETSPAFPVEGEPEATRNIGQIEMSWFINPDRLDVRV